MTKDYAEERDTYREALEKIIRYKRTPRAYRHTTFEQLIKIAEEALKDE
jgi:hypothetical protein